MSTNPNNAIGTNGAYGGRTSVEAFNDVLNTFTGAGILSGWECSPSSGMTVALGGVTGYRDVAVATDPTGAKTTINNRTSSAVEVTLDAAPSTNSRIDVIVAYVANPPQGSSSTVDNPGACGIIAVKGTVSASPSAPSDSTIRTAITADGAAGSTAYYVVLATISVIANITTITGNYITQGTSAKVASDKIDFATIKDDANNLPVSIVTTSIGYGIKAVLYRIGNLVFVSNDSVTTTLNGITAGSHSLGQTMPEGYRPATRVAERGVIGGSVTDADGSVTCDFSWIVSSDGTMAMANNRAISYSGGIRVHLYGVWFTDNDWPS